MQCIYTWIFFDTYIHPRPLFLKLSTGKLFPRKLVGRNLEALGAKIGILAIIVCVLVFIIGTLVAWVNSPGWTVWRGEIWFYHWTTYRLYMCWKLVEGCGLYNKLILNLQYYEFNLYVVSWKLNFTNKTFSYVENNLCIGGWSRELQVHDSNVGLQVHTQHYYEGSFRVWHQNWHVTKCLKKQAPRKRKHLSYRGESLNGRNVWGKLNKASII